jgi:hypothetical protein
MASAPDYDLLIEPAEEVLASSGPRRGGQMRDGSSQVMAAQKLIGKNGLVHARHSGRLHNALEQLDGWSFNDTVGPWRAT